MLTTSSCGRFALLASVSLLSLACGASNRLPARASMCSALPVVSEAPGRAPAVAGADQAPSVPALAPELQRLARAVRALDDGARDDEHHRVVRALRDASTALDEVEQQRRPDDRVRAAAERLETSGVESLEHSDDVRSALVAARERLSGHTPSVEQAPAFEAALVELADNIDALSPSQPLLEQSTIVRRSFRALTNAIFLTARQPAPFMDRSPEPRSAAEVLEHARADVLALGRADIGNVRERTSRAMYSVAELVEAVDASAVQVAAVRAEARRLEHDTIGPFAHTGWVERGLRAALDSLDNLDRCRESFVTGSVRAARRAAGGLPERGALPFQRAAVQDAFRATVGAFDLVLLDREACASSSGRSASFRLSRGPTEPR